ncbi:hypothetical protein D3C83_306020 [compost metagenome]
MEGHTAVVEQPALAKKRAQLVLERLLKLGADPSRLILREYGSSRPLDSKHENNARVSFRIQDTQP